MICIGTEVPAGWYTVAAAARTAHSQYLSNAGSSISRIGQPHDDVAHTPASVDTCQRDGWEARDQRDGWEARDQRDGWEARDQRDGWKHVINMQYNALQLLYPDFKHTWFSLNKQGVKCWGNLNPKLVLFSNKCKADGCTRAALIPVTEGGEDQTTIDSFWVNHVFGQSQGWLISVITFVFFGPQQNRSWLFYSCIYSYVYAMHIHHK